MSAKWLGLALVLCLGSLLSAGHATAQTSTGDALAALMLTPGDVNAALNAVGSDESVSDTRDYGVRQSGGTVTVTRLFLLNNGAIDVVLGSTDDGSPLTRDEQNDILSGQALQRGAQNFLDNIGDFTLSGSGGIGDADQSATFTGTAPDGTALNAVGDFFIKDNFYGIVMYATQGDTDPQVVGAVAQVLVNKFP